MAKSRVESQEVAGLGHGSTVAWLHEDGAARAHISVWHLAVQHHESGARRQVGWLLECGANFFSATAHCAALCTCDHRSVGLMDKASASGAGDSRFESWAGQTLPGARSRSSGSRRLRNQVLNEVELPSPLLVRSEGSPRAAASKAGGARSARARNRVSTMEKCATTACRQLESGRGTLTSPEWSQKEANLLHFSWCLLQVQNYTEGPLA